MPERFSFDVFEWVWGFGVAALGWAFHLELRSRENSKSIKDMIREIEKIDIRHEKQRQEDNAAMAVSRGETNATLNRIYDQISKMRDDLSAQGRSL